MYGGQKCSTNHFEGGRKMSALSPHLHMISCSRRSDHNFLHTFALMPKERKLQTKLSERAEERFARWHSRLVIKISSACCFTHTVYKISWNFDRQYFALNYGNWIAIVIFTQTNNETSNRSCCIFIIKASFFCCRCNSHNLWDKRYQRSVASEATYYRPVFLQHVL